MNKSSWTVMRQRDFGLMWWGGLISLMGTRMLQVALPITVLELTGSPTAMAAIVAASVVPQLVLGPLVGVLVDRWDRKRVLIIANIGQAAALLPLLAVHHARDLWICAAVTLLSASIAPFVSTAENALLPRLVGDEQLPTANSLNALNNNLARLIGPLAGGGATLLFGLMGVAIADAVTFLAAALLIALVRGRHRAEAAAAAEAAGEVPPGFVRKFAREFAEGIKVIVASRTLLIIFLMFAVMSVGEGIMGSLFAVWVTDVLHGEAPELSWLIAAQAVGGIAGGLVGGRFASRWSPRLLLGVGMLLFGAIDLAIFTYPLLWVNVAPGIVGMILVGIPGVIASAGAMTLFQRSTDDAYRGRAFAAVGTVMAASMLLGTGVAVLLTGPLPIVAVLSIQGITPMLAGLGALLLLKRTETDVTEEAEVSTEPEGSAEPAPAPA
ncbi:MFS transporter [Phytomonospora endophytica]|uniref:Multidrug efflux pump Tap n=1 Tax=Phytomonospora endophytica TaxID=714109 RepID=A0A841F5K3_9ACTN|nr:MFS transporter [Phytomonospora endophytica]MBB6032191.1 MFS family permease [Phytomonospora endophytica]GIG68540.1 MFS transporter [Phytomonospora endophytica]